MKDIFFYLNLYEKKFLKEVNLGNKNLFFNFILSNNYLEIFFFFITIFFFIQVKLNLLPEVIYFRSILLCPLSIIIFLKNIYLIIFLKKNFFNIYKGCGNPLPRPGSILIGSMKAAGLAVKLRARVAVGLAATDYLVEKTTRISLTGLVRERYRFQKIEQQELINKTK